MVIAPGGGYGRLAFAPQGTSIAQWWQKRGVAGFVLKYRLSPDGYRHPVPLLDAQRALRFVRSRAAEWNIDPTKIGMMGFSAGGHLAATLQTHYDEGAADAPDPVDTFDCRPDFAALIYPVITMKEGSTNRMSRDRLLGPAPEAALLESLSCETQVTPQTPPTILVHAQDDRIVKIENSRLMLAALQKAGVPCVLQEYPHGGHGFGLISTPQRPAPPGWMEVVRDWLKESEWVS